MDKEILEWVVPALKESHFDEKKYHEKQIKNLHLKYNRIQNRLEAMYLDKLDGRIDQRFFDRKSAEWKKEQDDLLRKMERYQNANRTYIDEGVKLLELSQRAVILYEKQNLREKRKILNFLLSNPIWKDGRLHPNYRQPFDLLAETNIAYQNKNAVFPAENGVFENWLPFVDSFRNQIIDLSTYFIASIFSSQDMNLAML